MKKTFLCFFVSCLLSTSIYAQIPTIKPTESQYEFISINNGTQLCFDKKTKLCEMYIYSDNQFEDKSARIALGKTTDEIMKSLINLRNAMDNEKSEFTINGYSFYVVSTDRLVILSVGKLDNTAGTYCITDGTINSVVKYFIMNKGVNVGDGCKVTADYVGYIGGMFWVSLPQYRINKTLINLDCASFDNKFTDFLKCEKNHELTIEEIASLKSFIEYGKIKENDDARFFLKIAENLLKDQSQP